MTSGRDDREELSAARSLRILAVSETWQGGNDYAFVRAFRRMGHTVRVVVPSEFIPRWRSKPMRALRRVMRRRMAAEFNAALLREGEQLRPDLLFVFKGADVFADTLMELRRLGAMAVQYYPDVSVHTHGPFLPKALPCYDWIFTTKSFGLADMREQLGIEAASFLPHAFDPEVHRRAEPRSDERNSLSCDASFIGSHSPTKEAMLSALLEKLPDLELKIWGPERWAACTSPIASRYQGQPLHGPQYAKAIGQSRINIALLSERRRGSSSGDRTTARTFEIPGCGGFMLHQRTDEVRALFEEGREIACFVDADELAEKLAYYLRNDDERRTIAEAGRRRAIASGYSTDDCARVILDKFEELRGERAQPVRPRP